MISDEEMDSPLPDSGAEATDEHDNLPVQEFVFAYKDRTWEIYLLLPGNRLTAFHLMPALSFREDLQYRFVLPPERLRLLEAMPYDPLQAEMQGIARAPPDVRGLWLTYEREEVGASSSSPSPASTETRTALAACFRSECQAPGDGAGAQGAYNPLTPTRFLEDVLKPNELEQFWINALATQPELLWLIAVMKALEEGALVARGESWRLIDYLTAKASEHGAARGAGVGGLDSDQDSEPVLPLPPDWEAVTATFRQETGHGGEVYQPNR